MLISEECSQKHKCKKEIFKRKETFYFLGYGYYNRLWILQKQSSVNCPKHDQCAGKKAREIFTTGLNTGEYYEISQEQKTEEFKEKYKKRASIEGKNAELKRFHGLCRARGYGLLSVSVQSKLAAIAVNIKRIASILSSLECNFLNQIWNLKK